MFKIQKGTLLIGLAAVLGLAVAYYLFLVRTSSEGITRSFLVRQQTIARAQAANLTTSFQYLGNVVSSLASLPVIEAQDSATVAVMEEFIERQRDKGLVAGIVLTDSAGKVLFNPNVANNPDTGDDLSDRDYFTWAFENEPQEGDLFIGRPVVSRLGASEGKTIVPIASPVYKDSELAGLLVASVLFDQLATRYAGLMRLSDTTTIHLLDQNGEVLYSSSGYDVDPNLFASLDVTSEGYFRASGSLVAYSPVTLSNQNWMFVIASPDTEIADASNPILIRQSGMFILIATTLMLYGVYVSQMSRKTALQNSETTIASDQKQRA